MKKSRIGLLIALAAAAVVVAVVLARRRDAPEKYRTAKVDRGDVTMSVSATGAISAVTTVQVGSQVSGIIAKLYADFNSRVKKGQLLAELDPTPFEQTIEQRRADLQKAQVDAGNAKVAFGRQQRLQQQGLASQADYDNAKAAADAAAAQVNLARAALAQAETNLKYSKIVSPIDGVVVNRAYDVGQTVAASFQAPTLFTIAQDLTKMQVQADVDEADIGRVRIGQPVRFTVDAYPDRVFRAMVSQIRLNATVNQNVVTYPVIVAVDNPDEQLRPSMTANITIDVATDRGVLRIPNAALRFKPSPSEEGGRAGRAGNSGAGPAAGAGGAPARPTLAGSLPRTGRRENGPTVYLLQADGTLKPARVHPGITDGQYTEIQPGDLREGDLVVTGLVTAKGPSQAGPRMRF
ncbi:MAG TPA: efflux RND transporter periplasmic adaptor subunit [Thermoanaerobaculia bacterium]|nr:efflux RND transporter periplasmic adaptor subunit [Thermoanaerobaculia bacterium]